MESAIAREPVQRGTYTVKEIAIILGISENAAYTFVKEGHFRVLRIGTAIRIPMLSFDRWLSDNEVI